MKDEAEIPLIGGRVTAGVVRIGETVRRPISGDPTLRHQLLVHLERVQFAGAPRFLGIDGRGREILSFLPGEVPSDLGRFSNAQLSAAAVLLRRFHDATVDFPPVRQQGAEVICHNDWSPTNAVFQAGLPSAMIDFDVAAPGLRLWDIGYSAWLWLDLGNPDFAADEQLRLLSGFADAYGPPAGSAGQVAAYALARQASLAVHAKEVGKAELAQWAASRPAGPSPISPKSYCRSPDLRLLVPAVHRNIP